MNDDGILMSGRLEALKIIWKHMSKSGLGSFRLGEVNFPAEGRGTPDLHGLGLVAVDSSESSLARLLKTNFRERVQAEMKRLNPNAKVVGTIASKPSDYRGKIVIAAVHSSLFHPKLFDEPNIAMPLHWVN